MLPDSRFRQEPCHGSTGSWRALCRDQVAQTQQPVLLRRPGFRRVPAAPRLVAWVLHNHQRIRAATVDAALRLEYATGGLTVHLLRLPHPLSDYCTLTCDHIFYILVLSYVLT